MILVFLAVLLSLSISTYSQDYERIGWKKNEVIKEFKNFKTSTIVDTNRTVMMVVIINGNKIIYTFDSNGYCDHTSVVAKDFNTAKAFQDYYLSKYTYLSNGVPELKSDILYTIFLNCDKNYVFSFSDQNNN